MEKVDSVSQFSRYTTFASLKVAASADLANARRLLEKAEQVCLISNSMRGQRNLVVEGIEQG